MGDTGLEPESVTAYENKHLRDFEKTRAAKCAAPAARTAPGPDPKHVTTVWERLSEPAYQRILEMVYAAEPAFRP